ncbi:16715_t:CDS:1, partial [Dentiscutata erythropus]
AIRGLRYIKINNGSSKLCTEEYYVPVSLRYYMIEDIETLYDEFIAFVLQNKDKDFIASWELDKQMKGDIYMEEMLKYLKAQSRIKSAILRNKIKLRNLVDSLMEERSIDNNRPKYKRKILYKCLRAKCAFSTPDQSLLSEKDFKIMREYLVAKYPEIKKKYNERNRKGEKIREDKN